MVSFIVYHFVSGHLGVLKDVLRHSGRHKQATTYYHQFSNTVVYQLLIFLQLVFQTDEESQSNGSSSSKRGRGIDDLDKAINGSSEGGKGPVRVRKTESSSSSSKSARKWGDESRKAIGTPSTIHEEKTYYLCETIIQFSDDCLLNAFHQRRKVQRK